MNLVDSSGWLEYFADGKNAKHYAPIIQDIENLAVSTINIYEVYKKIIQQRDEKDAIQAIALMQQSNVIEVTEQIAINAAKLSVVNSIPMADSLIIATAQSIDATIYTQDNDFKGFDNVISFKK